MADTNYRKLLLGILILAASVRLAVISLVFGDYRPTDDAAQWHEAALNFLDGRGLIITDKFLDGRGLLITETRKAYRTPVPGLYFAAIYSVFGVSVRAVQIANVILGVLTVWLAYDLVRRSFGVMPAFWAGIFVSLYPLFVLYTGEMFSETPVLMLIALGLWLVWIPRGRAAIWFAPAGIVLGLATLTRQTVLPIAVLVAVWSLGVRRFEPWLHRCLPGLVILAFLVLTLVPWATRNYLLFGRFVPLTSQGGASLWVANNPQADGTGVGDKYSPVPHIDVLPEVDRGIAYQKLAVRFIADDPLRFAHLTLLRFRYFWHLGYHGEGFREVAFLAIYFPTLTLAILGAWVGWRSNREMILLLMAVPVSLTAVHMVFLPVGRYRLPAELIMCMLAGIGTYWSLSKLIESKIAARST